MAFPSPVGSMVHAVVVWFTPHPDAKRVPPHNSAMPGRFFQSKTRSTCSGPTPAYDPAQQPDNAGWGHKVHSEDGDNPASVEQPTVLRRQGSGSPGLDWDVGRIGNPAWGWRARQGPDFQSSPPSLLPA